MTNDHDSSCAVDDLEAGAAGRASEHAIELLFAAALDGDRRAEVALHLLSAFDDTAHRASRALLRAEQDSAQLTPPEVLASIDRTVAALQGGARR